MDVQAVVELVMQAVLPDALQMWFQVVRYTPADTATVTLRQLSQSSIVVM